MTRNSPLFDRWYRRARRAFPQLPLRSRVKFLFRRLDCFASVNWDTRVPDGLVSNVVIRIDSQLQRHRWHSKLVFNEVAHELVHLVRPTLEHGVIFERLIVRMKAAMETDPAWY